MDVRVRFFGFTSELAGCAECTVAVTDPTLQAVWDRILNAYPNLSRAQSGIRFARNTEYASLQTTLKPGDVVSIIPPVAGG